ncbi:hypothetical protein BJV74DRAFT_235875 [Russula compacta]|nr:hypothetical protein BJV74DRAFT_235875 [Russula compacta]
MPREASSSHTGARTDREQFVLDPGSVADSFLFRYLSAHLARSDNAPLRVKLTGCFLFNTSVILGFGTAKAVYSYRGQAIVSTTLDWVSGTALAIVLYWLSMLESRCPKMWPLFFEVDYAPPILKFICRPEVRVSPLIFLSIIPVVMAAKRMRAVLDVRPYIEDFFPSLADNIFIMAIAGLLLAIFSFLQQVRRAMVPHRFDVLDNLLQVMGILLVIILLWMSVRALKDEVTIHVPLYIRSVPFWSTDEKFRYDFISSAAPFLTMLTVVEPRHRGE